MLLEDACDLLKALSDPTRLRLLALLSRWDTLCVCELEKVLELPQYSVSRHLGILRRAGLVEAHRDGQVVDYVLHPALAPAVKATIEAAIAVAADDPQAAADQQAAGHCCPGPCRR